MMKLADVRSAVLDRLYRLYEAKGPRYGLSRTQLEEGLDIHHGTMEAVLRDFRDHGTITYQPTAGGPTGVHLTAQGIEDFENPQSEIATYVQNIQNLTINAHQTQSTQLGAPARRGAVRAGA